MDQHLVRILVELPLGRFPQGPMHLHYAIGVEQARELFVGRPPPEFDRWGIAEYLCRRERAEALAKMIGIDIAYKLIEGIGGGISPTADEFSVRQEVSQ